MRRLLLLTLLLAVAAARGGAAAEPLIARTCNGSSDCAGWFSAPVLLEWSVAGGAPWAAAQDERFTQDTAGSPAGCIASDDVETRRRR